MRTLSALTLLAAAAAAIDDLGPCQSRCYDMAADHVGCDTDDYSCHCASWDSRFAPQLSSCMIEGCAFGDEGPTMDTKELKEKVCDLPGQSPAPSTPSDENPTGDSTSTSNPSPTTDASASGSQDPGETAPEPTSQDPDETAEPEPEPTDDDDENDDDDTDDADDGGSGAAGLSVGAAVLLPILGYFVL